MLNVTKTLLPNLNDYTKLLEEVWSSHHLSNNGVLVKWLERELLNYLGVNNIELLANGTLALQLAIKAADLEGEIITTPFSYVATTNAILWERCSPVFADIETNFFTIDPTKIEAAITKSTTAILATHVFGYPCAVEAIEVIAKKHKLTVIYDAAHAFGVKFKGESLLNYGDMSILSFHATKLFHTAEGGAVISNNEALTKKVNLLKRFGHNGEDEYLSEGINAKMSELHAAMGLAVLPLVENAISHRKMICEKYNQLLKGLAVTVMPIIEDLEYNYGYYPVVFSNEVTMLAARERLKVHDIYPRRYFYPSLNTLPFLGVKIACPNSEDIASRILCLPLSAEISVREVENIVRILSEG